MKQDLKRHPKHRMIPQLILQSKWYGALKKKNNSLFERIENKVLIGLHIFELIVIMLFATATTLSFAYLLPSTSYKTSPSISTGSVTVDTNVNTNTTSSNGGSTSGMGGGTR